MKISKINLYFIPSYAVKTTTHWKTFILQLTSSEAKWQW